MTVLWIIGGLAVLAVGVGILAIVRALQRPVCPYCYYPTYRCECEPPRRS